MANSQQLPIRENPEGEEFTCEICTEITSKNKKFKNKNLCKHPFCVDCIAKYVQVKIEDDETAGIKCPGLDCKQLLDPLSCLPIIQTSLFSKWCDLLFENYVLGFERFICPNRDCMALVVNECRGGSRERASKVQCPTCKQWFCLRCKLAWHAGYRCEENRNLRDPNNILFGQLVKKITRARCPGCGHCEEDVCRCKTQLCYGSGGNHPCSCDPKLEEFGIIVLVLLILVLIILL